MIWFDEDRQSRRPRMGRSKAAQSESAAPPRFANPFKHGRYSVAEEYCERLSSAAYQTMRHRTVIRYHRLRTINMMVHESKDAGASVDEIAAGWSGVARISSASMVKSLIASRPCYHEPCAHDDALKCANGVYVEPN